MGKSMGRELQHWMCGIAAFVTLEFFTGPAAAETYLVGPARAYKTLSDVASRLQPGDIVEVDGDATYAGGTAFRNHGAPAQPITVRGVRVNGKRPVLSGGTNTIEAAGDHYVFETLEITGGSSRCFYHHAHDVVLRDALIRDCPQQGLLGADTDSGSLTMEYVEVTRCGDGLYDHQIYMATDETANPGSVFRMQYCWVHDGNGGNNLKSRAERNEIYYNWFEGALYHELELIGPDPAGGAGTSAREDSDVVGNVLVKTNSAFVLRFGGDGTGETNGRYRFVNNTVVVQPNGSAVFRLFDGLESVEMHNNAFLVAGAGAGVNLLRTTEARWTNGRQIAGSNNWVIAGSTNLPAEWTATVIGSDPGVVDLAALDLRPADGSALVNGGTETTSGPAGYPFPSALATPLWHSPLRSVGLPGSAAPRPVIDRIDIGAYEYADGFGGAGSGGAAGGGSSGGAGGGSSGSGASSGSGGDGGNAGAGSGGTASAPAIGGAAGDGNPMSLDAEASGSGCGCRTASGRRPGAWLGAALLALVALRRRGAQLLKR